VELSGIKWNWRCPAWAAWKGTPGAMRVQTFLLLIAEKAVRRPNRVLPFVPVVCRALILGGKFSK
jgi:hypothetical protein